MLHHHVTYRLPQGEGYQVYVKWGKEVEKKKKEDEELKEWHCFRTRDGNNRKLSRGKRVLTVIKETRFK